MGAGELHAQNVALMEAGCGVTPITDGEAERQERLSDALARFEGGDEIPVSIFVTEFARGDGPPLHIHPYAEIFLVELGAVTFTVEDEQIEVAAGNIVVVAEQTKHKFVGASDASNRVISIHPAAHVVQDNLE